MITFQCDLCKNKWQLTEHSGAETFIYQPRGIPLDYEFRQKYCHECLETIEKAKKDGASKAEAEALERIRVKNG